MSTLNKSRRQHTRHQSLARQRKSGNSFLAYIAAEATRLAAPARVLRDRLRNLGSLTMTQLTAAADLTAAGVPRMTANPNVTFALVTAVTPGNVGFGVRTTAALTFAPRATALGTTGLLPTGAPGARTGTITRSSGSFVTDGFTTGDILHLQGTVSNNGLYSVQTVAAATLDVTMIEGESPGTPSKDVSTEIVPAPGPAVIAINAVSRASGSFVSDGFAVGDRVLFQTVGRSELEGLETQLTAVTATRLTLSTRIRRVSGHTSGASCTATATNVITRSTGSFVTNGFAIGDVILAGGTTTNAGRAARVKSVAATRIQTGTDLDVNGSTAVVRWNFEAAAASRTLTGPTTLTRAAGDWAADGFVAGDLIRVVGAAQAANNRDFRVKVVTSATVLRLETGNGVAEGPTSNVAVYRLNEQFGRD